MHNSNSNTIKQIRRGQTTLRIRRHNSNQAISAGITLEVRDANRSLSILLSPEDIADCVSDCDVVLGNNHLDYDQANTYLVKYLSRSEQQACDSMYNYLCNNDVATMTD